MRIKRIFMARPLRLRRLAVAPPVQFFSPYVEGNHTVPSDTVVLTLDEFEAIRLADLECHSQEHAARKMDVSRATFGRIIESGRSKVAQALVHGCCIEISGGAFMFGRGRRLQCPRCRRQQARDSNENEHVECRRCCQPLQHNGTLQHETKKFRKSQ
jgi:uncharacterized protein